jgi:diguanylate cyclase (GGDEF)-like protein
MQDKDRSLKDISLSSRLWLAFSFATFFPAAILIYHFFYLDKEISGAVIFVIFFVTGLGWWFIFDAFKRLTGIKARTLELMPKESPQVPAGARDEVAQLDSIFNAISSRMKDSVDELRAVSSRTQELHRQISRKVDVLSALLQVTALFSKGGQVKDAVTILLERFLVLLGFKSAAVFLRQGPKDDYMVFSAGMEETQAHIITGHRDFNRLAGIRDFWISRDNPGTELEFLKEIMSAVDVVIVPLYLREELIGHLTVFSDTEQLNLDQESLDTIKLFSHNLVIVWAYNRLSQKVEDLSMVDPLTGVYNERFFNLRLDEEIRRATAYQRPCGAIFLELANYTEYETRLSADEWPEAVKAMVKLLGESVRPIDILGRIRSSRLAVILIERNRRQSQYFALKLKEAMTIFLRDKVKKIEPRVITAVVESPIDGATAKELVAVSEKQFKGE